MTAPNHTPTSILALAREAAKWNKVFTNPPSEAERAWYRLMYECDPALIIALVERLRDAAGRSPSFEEYAMTTPLLPAPELEKQQ